MEGEIRRCYTKTLMLGKRKVVVDFVVDDNGNGVVKEIVLDWVDANANVRFAPVATRVEGD